ncbi:sigma-54 dependent transcriptional regulator [Anaeromyxobacter sp. Fw109-5]|uniref:sigma-54-dependent transcriptional regulator n=1 Tax=Anaeromyxobacter sp. (strain Fw109-5) TaxID=404589 RepID=UPI0000ED814D|nr:sigma-54 dependent transcriptional regulator [Anaeromyxobacter sp. Fw109-5]ABS25174.1 two component, sigma54 specific, transcriptional regulator, Fis family [Anaeromyxobacter sp. Fw109-5]
MTSPPAAAEGLVLLVDDDPGTRKVAKANLSLEGFEVLVASCGAEALARLGESDPLAVVSDLKMPDMDGIALMDRVHALRPSLPVVLVTAHATVETAVEAMRKGALHYLTKPIRYDELALVLRHAVAHERQRRDVARLRGELEQAAGFEEIVGTSPAMREVFSMVEQVADADATVLLRGETGTGKELVARAIHRRSARRDRPFVAVNCTAIPRDLMESEFFGHEKGAFTGAVARRIGRFEQAHGSTLFLDEIGDLDLSIQAKLLRVLQEQELTRVGAQDPVRVDVRIVAATNRDLEALVREGRFRDDLYYRLNVIPIRLPPLRERTSDLPALTEHFLGSFAKRYGRTAPIPPPDVIGAARAYPWPGNVRELRNLCERAVLMGWAAVAPILGAGSRADTLGAAALVDPSLPLLDAKQRLVERFEREYLTRLLKEHRGRIGEVARAAGIAERNLYEKMKAYGLSRDDYR